MEIKQFHALSLSYSESSHQKQQKKKKNLEFYPTAVFRWGHLTTEFFNHHFPISQILNYSFMKKKSLKIIGALGELYLCFRFKFIYYFFIKLKKISLRKILFKIT